MVEVVVVCLVLAAPIAIATAAWRRSQRVDRTPAAPASPREILRVGPTPPEVDAWREAFAPAGLDLVAWDRRDLLLAGKVDGYTLSVKRSQGAEGVTDVVHVAAGREGAMPRSFAAAATSGVPWEDDVTCGDDELDAVVELRGSPLAVHGMLGVREREALRLHLAGSVRVPGRPAVHAAVAEGIVSLELTGPLSPDAARQALEVVVETARRLGPGTALTSRLIDNACGDPVPGVRARCMASLADRTAGVTGQRRDQVLRQGLRDADAEVRFHAARGLGPEGVPTLVALARSGSATSALRVRAVAALPHPAADDLDRAVELARAVPPADVLALARSLESRDDPRAGSVLVLALPRASGTVLLAMVAALGRVGGLDAIGPLVALANGTSSTHDARDAAREAANEIQQRVGGIEPGRLSLAGSTAGGELSASPTASGGELAEPARGGELGEASHAP